MVGPEGKPYTEVLTTPLGRLGFRELTSGFRVRLEPRINDLVSVPEFKSDCWKRPSSEGNRFSLIVYDVADLASAIAAASKSLSHV